MDELPAHSTYYSCAPHSTYLIVHTIVVHLIVHTIVVHLIVQTIVVHLIVHTIVVHLIVQTIVVHLIVHTIVVHMKKKTNKLTTMTERGREDLLFFIFYNARHEGVQMDDLPPHCTYYIYAHEEKTQHSQ